MEDLREFFLISTRLEHSWHLLTLYCNSAATSGRSWYCITGKVLWSLWISTPSSEYKDNTGIFDINLTYLLLCTLWLFLSCFWIFETLRNFQNPWSMPFISGSPINSKVSKTSRPISLRQSAFGYISQCEYHNSFQLTCYIVHSCSAQSLLCNEIHTGSLWLTFHF